MEDEHKRNIFIIIAIIALGLLGWWLFGADGSRSGGMHRGEEAADGPHLAPSLELTEQEKAGDVSGKKAEILGWVRSGKPLSPEERAEIGGIMLSKAAIYNFTDEERFAIFKGLQR